jgi:hypothetical protein
MLFKFALFVISTLALLASALPTSSDGSCNGGANQCCNSVQDSSSASALAILALLGLPVSDLTGLIGFNCSPIVGAVGSSWCVPSLIY